MSAKNSCVICLDQLDSDETLVITTCGHPFHRVCINMSVRKKQECPICRAHLMLDMMPAIPNFLVRPFNLVLSAAASQGISHEDSMQALGEQVAELQRHLHVEKQRSADEKALLEVIAAQAGADRERACKEAAESKRRLEEARTLCKVTTESTVALKAKVEKLLRDCRCLEIAVMAKNDIPAFIRDIKGFDQQSLTAAQVEQLFVCSQLLAREKESDSQLIDEILNKLAASHEENGSLLGMMHTLRTENAALREKAVAFNTDISEISEQLDSETERANSLSAALHRLQRGMSGPVQKSARDDVCVEQNEWDGAEDNSSFSTAVSNLCAGGLELAVASKFCARPLFTADMNGRGNGFKSQKGSSSAAPAQRKPLAVKSRQPQLQPTRGKLAGLAVNQAALQSSRTPVSAPVGQHTRVVHVRPTVATNVNALLEQKIASVEKWLERHHQASSSV